MITGEYQLPDQFVSAEFDGLKFAQDDLNAHFKIFRFDGWFGSPGVRADRTDRLWAHGSFSERGWRESRLIILEGNAHLGSADAAVAAYNRLMSAGADGTYKTLTVTDSIFGVQTVVARIAAEVVVTWLLPGIFQYHIQLFAPDPRKYGQLLSASTGIASPGGGLVYPLGSPAPPGVLDYGAGGTPGTVALVNSGTADTAPAFTITGDLPNGFTITNVETGQRLVYTGAIIAGQTLRLDTADGSVKLEGYADRSALLTVRQWTRLGRSATGTWLFEASGSTSAQLTVEVKPAWW